VPHSWTHDRKTAVTEPSICSWNSEYIGMSRAKLSASRVRRQLTVVSQVRKSLTSQQAAWKQEWPACSRPAISTEANADYNKSLAPASMARDDPSTSSTAAAMRGKVVLEFET